MKKLFLSFLLLANLLVVRIPSVSACSCLPPGSPQDSLQQSGAVFAGEVTEIEKGANSLGVQFQVSQVWKGDVQKSLTLMTPKDSAGCGYAFTEGQDYMIYAYEDEGVLSTNLCSRTALLKDAQEDLKALGEADSPRDSGAESSSSSSDSFPFVWVLGGLAALIFLGLLFGGKAKSK